MCEWEYYLLIIIEFWMGVDENKLVFVCVFFVFGVWEIGDEIFDVCVVVGCGEVVLFVCGGWYVGCGVV